MDERPNARRDEVLAEHVGDELVLYDTQTRQAHCLAAPAAQLWQLCDGQRTVNEIASQLSCSAAEVQQGLQELTDTGLLDGAASAPRLISRRHATKRLAQAGAAAFSLPLIYSVAIPAAAAATSQTDRCLNVDCDDNNRCTIDTCDPLTGRCMHTLLGCNDNNACTIDTCDPVLGCIHTPVQCPNGGICDAVHGCVPS